MISVDWMAMILGGVAGAIVGALFFAGLAFGLRYALRTQIPIRVLAISALLRIGALLVAGWVVVGQGGPWAMLGFAIAFLVVRFVATTVASSGEVVHDPVT